MAAECIVQTKSSEFGLILWELKHMKLFDQNQYTEEDLKSAVSSGINCSYLIWFSKCNRWS